MNNLSSATSIVFRTFTVDDISAARAMSTAVSWPHRVEDWQFAVEQGTGFVAEENGRVVGTALCWKYGADHGSLGLVIVASEHQGRGIGRKLMETVLDELGGRITFLHATVDGQPLYEKLGFEVCGFLDQHQGHVSKTSHVVLADDEILREARPGDLPKLLELQLRATGMPRNEMLPALLQVADGGAVIERGEEIIGFSIFRRFGRGFVIGPVVALGSGDDVRAKALIAHWLLGREGEYVRVDVPSGTSLTDWLIDQGLTRVDTVPRMVRNASAEAARGASDPVYRSYGLISQAMF